MGLSVIRPQFLVFAVKSANFLMFTVSGENTVKCLKGFRGKPIVFQLCLLKPPVNFEPMLKGAVAVVSFFHPFATVFWGILGTNLVSGAHDPLVSVEAEGSIEWILLRCCQSSSELL